MKYICDKNPKHVFIHPAKYMDTLDWNDNGFPVETRETYRCPFCDSKEYSEFVEPEVEVGNVLVIELTTGPQIGVDKALSEGYRIVNRYAKSYVLEKPKVVEKDYVKEVLEVKEAWKSGN